MKDETRQRLIDLLLEKVLGRDFILTAEEAEKAEEEAEEEEPTPKGKGGK